MNELCYDTENSDEKNMREYFKAYPQSVPAFNVCDRKMRA